MAITAATIAGLGALGNVVSGVAQTAVGAWSAKKNYDIQKQTAEKNLQFQMDNLNYQKDLQQKIFDREDNAVQRTVADNRKAGLSPLAGITGANAGTAIATEAPQMSDVPQFDAALLSGGINSIGSSASNISTLALQSDANKLNRLNIESQIEQRKLEYDLLKKYGDTKAQTEIDLMEKQKAKYDSDAAYQEWQKTMSEDRFNWEKMRDQRDFERVVKNDVVDNMLKAAQKNNIESAISSRALSDEILSLNKKILEMNVADQTALDGVIRPAMEKLAYKFDKKADESVVNFLTLAVKTVLNKSPDLLTKFVKK